MASQNGTLVAVGAAVAALLLLRGNGPVASATPTGSLPANAPTTRAGVTTSRVGPPVPAVTGQPAAPNIGAPSVGNFSATRNGDNTVTVVWTGTLQASWNGSDSVGYDLYAMSPGGTWMLLQAQVEPPLLIQGLPAGSTIGVAPVYQTQQGQIVAGAISSATV